MARNPTHPKTPDRQTESIDINPQESHNGAIMDVRDRQILATLIEALRDEWTECHSLICTKYPANSIHECLHPKPKELQRWDNDYPKCAYCGAAIDRVGNKPWTIYCSPACNSAAWRQRKREQKELARVSD